ncbi:GH85 family endohexosaminidase C-terminal domain-containing protein [Streptomyces oceani]|uniref:Endo-beta-N-acetylglucosaminidase D-like D2 domain-containing protein n=1 Tax=Streptomyces oceani TaxID=1075402 RepID=A0A1E7KJH2_9ACTN|nr:hypothetical protein [Streptomyces oceani]OEV04109.1 hypothetical protein AN216_07730 [Streptomyces oceani]
MIGAFPFVTRFNTGHGRSFFLEGKRASEAEWNNASIQDILPTWQFWTRSGGSGEPLTVDYDYDQAYDGGCALRVSGELGPDNPTTVRLFKTRLRVTGGERLSVTYATGAAGEDSGLEVGVLLADDPERFVWLPVGVAANRTWNHFTQHLDAFRGRTIAAVGVRVSAARRRAYALHLGELALLEGGRPRRPERPRDFTVDAVHPDGDRAEVFLSWRFAGTGVWYYDIHRELPRGGRQAVGRILDEVYYVKTLTRLAEESSTTLQLTAVGPDGTRGAPARVRVRWT